MAIKNVSQKIILAEKHKICKSLFSKAIGLMFSKKIKDFALVLAFDEEKRISLHMFFVFYPIDVLFLNRDKRVVERKKNFRPFAIYNSVKRAKYAVELPCGIIGKTKINDKIEF
ncbi:MAG: DUF192 domain-containing protein [Candidatus Woesearchaeota archaeon]|nr:DUF192 domain-containing protein [Candidatus Woesearchaeota archaeon]